MDPISRIGYINTMYHHTQTKIVKAIYIPKIENNKWTK